MASSGTWRSQLGAGVGYAQILSNPTRDDEARSKSLEEMPLSPWARMERRSFRRRSMS